MTVCRYVAATLVLVFASVFLGAAPGRAAQPILSDPLTTWPLNFGTQSTTAFAKNGSIHLALPPNNATWVSYTGFTFTDMDASLTITPNITTGNAAGLTFWGTGSGNFFEFYLADQVGLFALFHRVPGANPVWQNIVPWTKNAAIKVGGPNTLRVVTKGNSVTLFANGQLLGELNVMAPATGGMVGFEGESGSRGPADYSFTNLIVSQ